MKKYNLGNIKVEMETNGYIKGLVLNREITVREARYILDKLLGYNLNTVKDCFGVEEYNDYNKCVKKDVNAWLKGECDDYRIFEYAFDCPDEGAFGAINMISVLEYLKRRGIID